MSDVTGSQRERYDKTIRRRDKLASFLYDLAKACFTLMVISGLWMFFNDGYSSKILCAIAVGIFGTSSLAYLANRIMIY